MLQHNIERAGDKAHLAHAAFVGFHAICCGLPALAMIAAALSSGALTGAALLPDAVFEFHRYVHSREIWILALSAGLVSIGAALEALAWRGANGRRFSWLFLLSASCFAINAAIILAHRAG